MVKSIKKVINHFLELLNQRKIDECKALIEQHQRRQKFAHCCIYFDAILSEVMDHDWAKLQRNCQQLYDDPLVNDYLKGQVAVSLGIAYSRQAMWPEALAIYDWARNLFKKIDEPIEEAKTLTQLSLTYLRGYLQGDFEQAKLRLAQDACENSLHLLETLPSEITANTSLELIAHLIANTLNTLGTVHNYFSEFEVAEDAFLNALKYARKTDDILIVAIIHDSLGETYYMAGRFSEAEEQYANALEILRTLNQDSVAYELSAHLANLAFLMERSGRAQSALDYYHEAINLIEQMRADNNSLDARTGFSATVAHIYANAILACIDAGRKSQAFDYMELARARAFLDMLDVNQIDRDQIENQGVSATLDLQTIQARLPADAVLVEYFTTGVIESKNDRALVTQRPIGFPEAKTIICIITQNEIVFHDAGISPNLIYPSDLEEAVERYFLSETILHRLYQLLIKPIKRWVKDKRWIYIIPHGPLHYVPFQALTSTEPALWLQPGAPQFIYAPSATILFKDLSNSDGATRIQNSTMPYLPCLAIGYNGVSKPNQASVGDYVKYQPLQMGFAEIEAISIAQLTSGDAITGSQAKKEILELRNYRWLHISCHGNFNPDFPLQSTLHLGPDEKLTAQEVLHPLSLSCDLAVLSACESGLSLVQRGDELLGLVRAFLYAGTKAMIVTQWRVDEGSTCILMERFYRYVQAGQGFADALQLAQHDLRNMCCAEVIQALKKFKKIIQQGNDLQEIQRIDSYIRRFDGIDLDEQVFAEPYYWSPFILIGQNLLVVQNLG